MNTKYQNRVKSPYQPTIKRDVYDVSNKNHPVREVINKCIGNYNIIASFEEDRETVAKLKNPSIVAFTCTIKRDGNVIGIGRGHSALSPVNKYIEKTVHTAFNYSLIDAISKTTRIIDALHTDKTEMSSTSHDVKELESNNYTAIETCGAEMITDKQRNYLLELINVNVSDSEERDRWSSQISEFTKEEASEAIQTFKS